MAITVPPALDKLASTKVSPKLVDTVKDLAYIAEKAFPDKSGSDKKAWVRKTALDLLAKVDIKAIPDWLEEPAKAALVDLVIDVVCTADFELKPRRRRRIHDED
jgi:hypothetical protein